MKYNLDTKKTQLTIKSLKHKTSSASVTYRFDDPFLPGAVVPGLAQQLDVLREDEGPGNEAELLLAEAYLHLGQVPPQPVLPADLERSREVVQLGRGINGRTDRSKCESRWAHFRPALSVQCPPTFWCSPMALKPGDFMWCPQQPSQSWLSAKKNKTREDRDQSFNNNKRETKFLKLKAKNC